MTHLAFEDFLEALTRIAILKSWPTPDEIAASGASGAGRFLLGLKTDNPDAYAELKRARAVSWGAMARQHVSQCVEHLCSLMVATCQEGKGDDRYLTEQQVAKFVKKFAKAAKG